MSAERHPAGGPGEGLSIRTATAADHDAVWAVLEPVIRSGDTFAYDPATGRDEALASWFRAGGEIYVAERREAGGVEPDGAGAGEQRREVVGTALLRPNQPGLGSHVANASFAVAPAARGEGVGRALALHALKRAERLGYRAMQFNLVVASNEGAIALWRSLGFEEVARLPEAFRLRGERYVDALIMRRELGAPGPRGGG